MGPRQLAPPAPSAEITEVNYVEPSQKVLIGAGLLNIAYGFVTGFGFAWARTKAEFAPRYLVMAHTGPFQMGAMLMGLSLTIPISNLQPSNEELAARLLFFFSVCIATKDTFNWLAGVDDEFAQKPTFSRVVGAAGALGGVIGLSMLIVGFLGGYWAV